MSKKITFTPSENSDIRFLIKLLGNKPWLNVKNVTLSGKIIKDNKNDFNFKELINLLSELHSKSKVEYLILS